MREDLYPTAAIAAATLAAMVHLAPGPVAHASRDRRPRAQPPAAPAWVAPPSRPAPPVIAPTPASLHPAPGDDATEAAAPERDPSQGDTSELSSDGETFDGIGIGYRDFYFDEYVYGRRPRISRRWYRPTSRTWRPRPAMSWVDASAPEGIRSACEVIPALCGELSPPRRRAAPAPSPELIETPERFTLANAEIRIDIERVARCVVTVRRAEVRADTLLTFDRPDELVPCEARVVPDLTHVDGVAVRLDARGPSWTQSVTISLGADDDAPTVAIARAVRDGAAVVHDLVNASSTPMTFTLDGRDLVVAPGEVVRTSAR